MQTVKDPMISTRRLKPQAENARGILVAVIEFQAGIRYRELVRKTGLTHGVLSNHIKIMERQKRIIVKRNNGATRFFPCWYDDDMCNLIANTSHPTTRRIVSLLLNQECSHYQIKTAIGKSGSTISVHMKKLESAGLVSTKKSGRVRIFCISDITKATAVSNGRKIES